MARRIDSRLIEPPGRNVAASTLPWDHVMLRFSALTLAALLLSTGAHAAMVGGWEVSDKPDDKNLCSIQHSYEDKNDDNAKNSVGMVFVKDEKGAPAVVIALGYAKWDLTKGEKSKADVLFDDKVWQRGV